MKDNIFSLILNIDLGQSDDAFLELLRLRSSAGMNVVGVSFAGNWTSELICRKMAAMAKLAFVAGRSLGHGNMHVIDVGTPDLEAFDFQRVRVKKICFDNILFRPFIDK